MNQRNIITVILSTFAGAAAALVICLGFFYYKPAQTAQKPFENEMPAPTPLRKEPESPQGFTTKVKLSEINSLTLSTSYTGFYDANSECGKSSNPAPKLDNSISLSYSPCRTELTFNRSGEAAKSLSLKRPDKNANAPEEKSEWKSEITAEQFETLLKTVAGNPDLLEWENIEINHGNCALWAYYNNNGVMHLPLFVDITRETALPASLKGFKDLDAKAVWKKN